MRQTIQRRHHRYWPFYRYADGWWHHPYCQPPFLMWMGKPTEEEKEEKLKDCGNILEQIIKFAVKFKKVEKNK